MYCTQLRACMLALMKFKMHMKGGCIDACVHSL